MAAFDAEATVPPQVTEGAESVSIIVLGGEATAVEPEAGDRKRVITSKARVIRK